MKRSVFPIAIFLSLLIMPLGVPAQPDTSGPGDFDFYIGSWLVHNQREMDDGSWVEFPAEVEVFRTMNGYGNVDIFRSVVRGAPFEGMTIRQYDADTGEWRIRWYDSDDPTAEPSPSVGKFEDGEGKFYKTVRTDSGHEVLVRFYWYDIQPESFRWECAWTVDKENWNPVWTMDFTRKRKASGKH